MPPPHKPKYRVVGDVVHLPKGGQAHIEALKKLRTFRDPKRRIGEWRNPDVSFYAFADGVMGIPTKGRLMLAISPEGQVYTYKYGGKQPLTHQLTARQLDNILRTHGGK